MAETFFRVHWADAPDFSPENARSALWGSTRSEDGTKTECTSCIPGDREGCKVCGGTGWEDCMKGYSCCWSAEDLVEYMAEHGAPGEHDRVIVFEGVHTGTGFDGEPLAVPTRIIEETTWSEFLTRTS